MWKRDFKDDYDEKKASQDDWDEKETIEDLNDLDTQDYEDIVDNLGNKEIETGPEDSQKKDDNMDNSAKWNIYEISICLQKSNRRDEITLQ